MCRFAFASIMMWMWRDLSKWLADLEASSHDQLDVDSAQGWFATADHSASTPSCIWRHCTQVSSNFLMNLISKWFWVSWTHEITTIYQLFESNSIHGFVRHITCESRALEPAGITKIECVISAENSIYCGRLTSFVHFGLICGIWYCGAIIAATWRQWCGLPLLFAGRQW